MNYSELPRHNGNFVAAAWECWYGASDRACTVTAITWRWYCRTFLGAEAVERYEAIGQLLMAIAIWVYAQVKDWVDAEVKAATPDEATATPEELTPVSTLPTWRKWAIAEVLKVRDNFLPIRRHLESAASKTGAPQLRLYLWGR